jgi:excisionase family DNA binding protein
MNPVKINLFHTGFVADAVFGVHRKTLYRWVSSGKIGSHQTPDRKHLFSLSEINRVLAEYQRPELSLSDITEMWENYGKE